MSRNYSTYTNSVYRQTLIHSHRITMAEKREQSPRIEDDTNVDEELQQMQARLLQMEAEKNAVRRVASLLPGLY
jgi:hypothetical protein